MKKKSEKEEFNSSLKLIAKSSLIVFIGLFMSKIFTYLYRIIIARHYGPEIYGIFSLAVMILLWIVSIASFGLIEGVLRFIPYYRGKKDINKIRYLVRYSIIFCLISGVFFLLVLFFLSKPISINIFNEPKLSFYLQVFSILIPAYLILYILLSVIRSFEKIAAHSFIQDFFENFMKFIFLVLLILIGLNSNAIIFSYFLGVISSLLLAYIYSKKRISEAFSKYELEEFPKDKLKRKLFIYSWPLVFSGILYGILPFIDSFTIGYFKGAEEVGLYNAAVPIATLMVLVPNLFVRLFFPIVTREFSKKNHKVVSELSKQIEKWILILNIPVFLLLMLFPGTFINIFFGPEFLTPSVENSLRFLSIGFLAFSMVMPFNNLIQMKGKSKILFLNIMFISLFNLFLNIILVPKYGISGAAFSTMIMNLILSITLFFQVKHYLYIIPFRRKMIRILFSATIPALTIFFTREFFPINILTISVQGIFFVLFYVFFILITKSLDKNDIMILSTIKRKLNITKR